jgi:glycosyltransferase involved in cell wall biosynthesis
MSLFALPFGAERLEHVVYVVDTAITDPDGVIAAVRAMDHAKSRGTMLAVGGRPQDSTVANALGLEWEYLNRGIAEKSILGQTLLAHKTLKDLEADRVVNLSQRFKLAFDLAAKIRGLPRVPEVTGDALPILRVDPATADPRHIAIILKTNLTRQSAHVAQTLNTAFSLVRRGWKLTMCAPIKQRNIGLVMNSIHGVTAAERDRIDFLPFQSAKRQMRSTESMCELMNELVRRGCSVVYFRQLRISTWLLPAARARGLRVFLEVHQPYTTWAGSARRRMFGGPRNIEFATDRKFARADREFERDCYRLVDGVICTTDAMERFVRRLCPGAPTLMLRNGAPVARDFGEPRAWADRDIELIYTGKTAEEKGTDVLVESMRHLPDNRLLVVGGPRNSNLRPYRRLADSLGVRPRCKFLPWESQTKLFDRIARAKVAVHPIAGRVSREWRVFTCPLKVLEYMAIGTPVVATDLPAIRELIEPDINGILVPPGDPEALARGIRRLLEDPELAMTLVANARRSIARWAHDARARTLEEFLALRRDTVDRAVEVLV